MLSLQVGTEPDAVQETLLGEALEHAPVGAIVLDEEGRYLAANREACRLTGYTREELLQRGPADLAADASVVSSRLREDEAGTLRDAATAVQTRARNGQARGEEAGRPAVLRAPLLGARGTSLKGRDGRIRTGDLLLPKQAR